MAPENKQPSRCEWIVQFLITAIWGAIFLCCIALACSAFGEEPQVNIAKQGTKTAVWITKGDSNALYDIEVSECIGCIWEQEARNYRSLDFIPTNQWDNNIAFVSTSAVHPQRFFRARLIQ